MLPFIAPALNAVGNTVVKVAGAFKPNAEAQAARDETARAAALAQFAAEFQRPKSTWFDSLMDGINRLPRPIMALGVIGMFTYAFFDPIGFSAKMQAITLIPDPLWQILMGITGFYFVLRHFDKGRAAKVADVGQVAKNIEAIEALRKKAEKPPAAPPTQAQNNDGEDICVADGGDYNMNADNAPLRKLAALPNTSPTPSA